MVPPANSEALEKAILELIPDEKLKNSLSERGFRRIIEHLQWKKVADLMTESYQKEINKMLS